MHPAAWLLVIVLLFVFPAYCGPDEAEEDLNDYPYELIY